MASLFLAMSFSDTSAIARTYIPRYHSSSYSSSNYRSSRRYYPRRHRRYNSSYYRNRYYNPAKEKSKTTWEAPTKVDNLINEDIEKAQVDYGPTSPQAANLMLKYAKQYMEAKEFKKAKTLSDQILQLDKASKIDNFKIQDVRKLRANALKEMNKSSNSSLYRHSYKPKYSVSRRSHSNVYVHSPKHYTKPIRSHSTLSNNLTKHYRGPGVTEISYSSPSSSNSQKAATRSKSLQSRFNRLKNSRSAASIGSLTYSQPVSAQKYSTWGSLKRSRSYSYPSPSRKGLDKLNDKFSIYN